MPYALSFLATHDIHGFVPGVNDIINGYTKADGTVEIPLSEKIERGQKAITALQQFREAKKTGDQATMDNTRSIMTENMKYFGYGYIKDCEQIVPYIPVCFYAFRIMVGGGCLFILLFVVILFFLYKKDILQPKWLHWAALICIPIAYIVSESGWLVAEFGRQPWTIQDMLPTWVGVSDLQSSSVMITFFLFLILFTTMLLVEINILCKQIKKGPEGMESER